MVKTNRADSQKSGANDTKKQQAQTTPATPPATPVTNEKKGKQTTLNRKSTIGGTAVQGAKSTQPKEISAGGAAQQQAESYNRDMRRRMQHMGTGPYAEHTSIDPRERRRKRAERVKERQDRIKHAVDTKGPSRDVKLGRRNTYFLIAVAAALVILIVVALFVNHVL